MAYGNKNTTDNFYYLVRETCKGLNGNDGWNQVDNYLDKQLEQMDKSIDSMIKNFALKRIHCPTENPRLVSLLEKLERVLLKGKENTPSEGEEEVLGEIRNLLGMEKIHDKSFNNWAGAKVAAGNKGRMNLPTLFLLCAYYHRPLEDLVHLPQLDSPIMDALKDSCSKDESLHICIDRNARDAAAKPQEERNIFDQAPFMAEVKGKYGTVKSFRWEDLKAVNEMANAERDSFMIHEILGQKERNHGVRQRMEDLSSYRELVVKMNGDRVDALFRESGDNERAQLDYFLFARYMADELLKVIQNDFKTDVLFPENGKGGFEYYKERFNKSRDEVYRKARYHWLDSRYDKEGENRSWKVDRRSHSLDLIGVLCFDAFGFNPLKSYSMDASSFTMGNGGYDSKDARSSVFRIYFGCSRILWELFSQGPWKNWKKGKPVSPQLELGQLVQSFKNKLSSEPELQKCIQNGICQLQPAAYSCFMAISDGLSENILTRLAKDSKNGPYVLLMLAFGMMENMSKVDSYMKDAVTGIYGKEEYHD